MKKILFFICFVLWGTIAVYAQRGIITDTVMDDNGELMPGVNVAIDGKTIGTITNDAGKFSLVFVDTDVRF